MKNSKLLVLLQTFDEKKLLRLLDAVQSPYFNKDAQVTQLYQYLLETRHQWQQATHYDCIDKAFVFAQMGFAPPYHAPTMYYLMSNLLSVAERFIATEALAADPLVNSQYLLTYYNQPSLDKHFAAALRQAQHYQQQQSLDAHYYRDDFLLHQQQNLHFDRQKQHRYDNSLQQAIDKLDLYYLALKLKYSCEMLNRQKVVASSQYQLRLIEPILEYLHTQPLHHVPAVAIYAAIYRCLTDAHNEAHFDELKQLLEQHAHQFSRTEQRDMYAYLTNYCVRKINTGNAKFLALLLSIYQQLLSSQLLLDDLQQLSPWTYMNIVTIGIRNHEDAWTEQFIEIQKNYLATQFRHNAYHYNLATLRFYQKQYAATIGLLQQVVFDDVFYNTEPRMLLLRTYYELQQTDAFEALAASFVVYLGRNKVLSPDKKTRTLQFIKLLLQLHRIPTGNTKALNALKKKIDRTAALMNKAWLLDKWQAKRRRE